MYAFYIKAIYLFFQMSTHRVVLTKEGTRSSIDTFLRVTQASLQQVPTILSMDFNVIVEIGKEIEYLKVLEKLIEHSRTHIRRKSNRPADVHGKAQHEINLPLLENKKIEFTNFLESLPPAFAPHGFSHASPPPAFAPHGFSHASPPPAFAQPLGFSFPRPSSPPPDFEFWPPPGHSIEPPASWPMLSPRAFGLPYPGVPAFPPYHQREMSPMGRQLWPPR